MVLKFVWCIWLLCNTIILEIRGDCTKPTKKCHSVRSNALNVHIVPHTHLDVGWIKTFDEYYWGTRSRINKSGVRYIIDSVIIALLQNPKRRFILVETAYLQKWWSLADTIHRNLFKKLVHDKQLEIVGGGWTMNDEACTNYQTIIDQFTIGLKFLNETLGPCGLPKTAWQVDTFGHSREMASILSQMGYDAIFVGRVDHRDKLTRLKNQTLEMIWQGNPSLGANSNIFLSIIFNGYMSPPSFCFDSLCNDEPIVDNIESPEYNLEEIVSEFAEYVKIVADCYTSNHLLVAMGGDFHYENAIHNFANLDKLIEGFKRFNYTYHGSPINVIYSTPNCYIKAVNKRAKIRRISYSVKTDDFFPYSSDDVSFWTGFYTSRPTSKKFERDSNNILQVTKQLSSFVLQTEDHLENLNPMKEAMAMMQHHDAITGTEKQHVANDYHRLLTEAFQKTVQQTNNVLSLLLPLNPANNIDLQLNYCLYANVSICKLSQEKDFLVAVYNPSSRSLSHYVRLPVTSGCFTISNSNYEGIPYDVFPAIDEFSEFEDHNPAQYELVFYAENLPPLGLKLYVVEQNIQKCKSCVKPDITKNRYVFGDNTNGFKVNSTTGFICDATLNRVNINLKQEFLYYLSARGDNTINNRASGAYVFRPSIYVPNAIKVVDNVHIETYRGSLVEELHQIFNPWIKQIVRIYKKSNYFEFDWLIGPIDIKDYEGKEIISRFTTDLNSVDIFYTDSNGRQMMKRTRNYRPTFELDTKEVVSCNYFPVSSRISIIDEKRNLEFAVITDRSQGGSSLNSGELELMIHRRMFNDDGLGVNEELNERQFGKGLIVRGKHYITFGQKMPNKNCPASAVTQKEIVRKQLMTPMAFVIASTNLQMMLLKEISGLSTSLPRNVQILTLEPWKPSESTLLLRLEHLYELGEDQFLSQPAIIMLDKMFNYFEVENVQELSLGADRPLRNGKICGSSSALENKSYLLSSQRDFRVKLNPMDIRTFILTVRYK